MEKNFKRKGKQVEMFLKLKSIIKQTKKEVLYVSLTNVGHQFDHLLWSIFQLAVTHNELVIKGAMNL